MKESRKKLGVGLGTIGAIAAVLLLMPLSAAGSVHGALASTVGGKTHSLGEVGRPVALTPTVGAAGHAEYLGMLTVPANGAAASAPRPTASSGLMAAVVRNPTSPQLLGSFTGANQSTSGGWTPPDTQVAQGGAYVFEVVNEYAIISSTTGTAVASFNLQSFFGTTSTDNVGDVQVFYDQLSKRWLVAADDFTTNNLYWAVSNSSSPVGSYYGFSGYVYFVGGGAQFMDQPVWGVSKTLYGVGVNIFNSTTLASYGSLLWVFGKTKMNNGHLSYQILAYGSYFSVHPAREVATNGSGTDILYAASTGSSPSASTTLTEFEVSGTVGSLSTTSIAYSIVNTGYVPGGVQAGTTTLVATDDSRVQSVSWGSNALWVSFSTACTPAGDGTVRSCIRVDAIYTPLNTLTQDTDTAVAGSYLFYGALTALKTGAGYLMVLGYSSALSYPSIAMSGQNTTDAYGTYRGPVPAFSGSSYDTSGRFGDYSGISLSTTGGAKVNVWAASEYDTTAGWATEVVHFSFY